MSAEITDRQLLQLIQGELPAEEERHLENLLSLDAQLRVRLERLSGGDEWAVGSAPIPPPHQSARLSLAMEQVGRYITTGSSATHTPHDLPKLPTLSGITLVRQIGQGGMGVVYEGIDDTLGRRVAVKFIQPMRAASAEAQERLIREAKATAALHHDNIVTIHSIQTVDGTPALIQQYIDGQTLQEVLDSDGALPIERCIDLARQLAQGLAAAHAAGIVHRDLKPGNVLIEKQTGKARLADFGMAKHIAELHLSSPDVVSGTPAYMSPEQTRGEPTDGRSDLFSLGAILYTAIAGQTPFGGDDPFVVMDQVRSVTHTPLVRIRPESPAWLNAIIDSLLAKQIDDRLTSAADLLKILDASNNSTASPRKYRGFVVAGIGLVCAALVFAWWPSVPESNSKSPAVASPPVALAAPMIWIGDPSRAYTTLLSAVKDAADGDEITLANDVMTEQIDIVGKRLTFRAAPGTRPSIRPTEWAIEHSPFLFRTDRDLTVQGLNIDWPVKTEPLSEPGATFSAILAVTQGAATLLVEDCTIHREHGICIASAGNLTARRSRISGGKFAIGWAGNNTRAEVIECLLDCDSSLVVMFPSVKTTFHKTATAHFRKCSLVGQGFVDFILFHHVDHPVELVVENCVFDVQRMVQLSATTIVANLSWEWVAQSVVKTCVKWRETDCVHQTGIEYLASRRIRGANRWMMGDLRGLDAWQKFWSGKPQDPPAIQSAREEPMKTQLPPPDWRVPESGDWQIHKAQK